MATHEHAIMVVDDERALRELLSDVLFDAGFQTVEATNGQDAMNQLRHQPEHICLILLDLMMPVMDGLQFRTAQRSDPTLNTIPVIAMSADKRQLSKVAQLDVATGLEKPLDFDQLLHAINQYCL